MRINVISPIHGLVDAGTDLMNFTFTGPLILDGDPLENRHAATKSYVDSRFGSLDASVLNGALISEAVLPAFGGDVDGVAGSPVVDLKDTGVVPGTHTKVSVDVKGRVETGGGLDSGDLPNVNWSKVTKNKPSTLDGYGISEALPLTGGQVGPEFGVAGTPENDLHLINRKYLGDELEVAPVVPVGGIIETGSDETPPGYLRCNGAVLRKDMYPELYSVIGDKFNNYVTPGSGKPWKQQYSFNDATGIGSWVNEPNLPGVRSHSQAVVTKNRVYLLGGYADGTVISAPINTDGTLGSWASEPNLPGPRAITQAVVTKNRVYLLGGHTGSGYMATVISAPINTDGTLGSWASEPNLPGPRADSQAVVTKNRVYLLGGYADGTVISAPINTDGTLGSWASEPNLPGPRGWSQAIVTKNRVYLLGGAGLATVISAPINEDGTIGSWASEPNLPGVRGHSQAVVTKNRVYLLGGSAGTTVVSAPINTDGTLGSWVSEPNLPGARSESQAVVTKNRVYLLGGAGLATVVSAPLIIPEGGQGGYNDYSQFYDGSLSLADPDTHFFLPDLPVQTLENELYYYIRS